jgi:peptidoglycan/LPS O-acetylase OafA/YrhL
MAASIEAATIAQPWPIAARRAGMAQRVDALDGLRGVLALVVAIYHLLSRAGNETLVLAANLSVFCFFLMSGYVLAIGYDGRLAAFLVRRVVRLWPVYAVCIVAGFALLGRFAPWGDLAMWPPMPFNRPVIVDVSDWSLYVELWCSPALLAFFWIARRGREAILATALLCAAGSFWHPWAFTLAMLACGVAASRFDIRWPGRVPGFTLWLGRISYSLYLSHWVVISACVDAFGRRGLWVAWVAVLPVGWMMWRLVERPSITLSRQAARLIDKSFLVLFFKKEPFLSSRFRSSPATPVPHPLRTHAHPDGG